MGDPGQVDRNADEAAERDRAMQALVETVQGLGSSAKWHGEAMGAIVEAVGLLADEVNDLNGLIRGTRDRVDKWEDRVARLEAAMNRPAMERLEFIQKACLQAGHDLELALQQAMGEALRDPESAELAGGFPTIDPSIATKGDVEELNAWGVAAAQRLRDAGVVATSAPIVKRLAEIIYGLRDLGKDERLVKRMGGDQITSRTWAQAAPVQSAGEPSAIGAAWATLAPMTVNETPNRRQEVNSMGGISCIGRMGGRKGDWFAELDFDAAEATIIERGAKGERIGPIATVPLGAVVDADEDHDQELDTTDDRNKTLCAIVFAPEAWRLLQYIREKLEARRPLEDRGEIGVYRHEIEDEQLLREVSDTLECLIVPGRGE